MAWPTTASPASGSRFDFLFRDYEGKIALHTLHAAYTTTIGLGVPTGNADVHVVTFIQSIGLAVAAAINAQLAQVTFSQTYGFGAAPGAQADYANIKQKAIMVLKNTTSGDTLELELPAPLIGNFLPSDDSVIDPANAQVIAWVAALNNTETAGMAITTKDGTPVVAIGGTGSWVFQRGYLTEKKPSKHLQPGWSSEVGGN